MTKQRRSDSDGQPTTELIAGYAAAAARSVPGVRALVPGLATTVVNAARKLVNRPSDGPDGVEITWSGGRTHLRLNLAVDGSRSAATIAAAVQHAVVEELSNHRDELAVGADCRVDVTILDVTVPSQREFLRSKA